MYPYGAPERPGLKVFRAGVLLWEHVLTKKWFRPNLGEKTTYLFNVPGIVENVAVVVLQPVGARSDYFGHRIGPFPWWRELVFFLSRLGPLEYEITDFEYPPSDLPSWYLRRVCS